MVLSYVFFYVAYLATAIVHLHWNELVTAAIALVVQCLSNPGSPILLSLLKLHGLVLMFFMLATCFHTASSWSAQDVLEDNSALQKLGFDDLSTDNGGFGDVPQPYHHLSFTGLQQFNPQDRAFQDIISPNDHNCAVSKPNGLYGSRYDEYYNSEGRRVKRSRKPRITVDVESLRSATLAQYFTLHSLKFKPLDMPISQASMFFTARQWACVPAVKESLNWNVTFPAGYHDMLHVRFEEFTGQKWAMIEEIEMWADFQNGGSLMDWEFCIDDIEIEFTLDEHENWRNAKRSEDLTARDF